MDYMQPTLRMVGGASDEGSVVQTKAKVCQHLVLYVRRIISSTSKIIMVLINNHVCGVCSLSTEEESIYGGLVSIKTKLQSTMLTF